MGYSITAPNTCPYDNHPRNEVRSVLLHICRLEHLPHHLEQVSRREQHRTRAESRADLYPRRLEYSRHRLELTSASRIKASSTLTLVHVKSPSLDLNESPELAYGSGPKGYMTLQDGCGNEEEDGHYRSRGGKGHGRREITNCGNIGSWEQDEAPRDS